MPKQLLKEITPDDAVNRLANGFITQVGLDVKKETINLNEERMGRTNLVIEILAVLSSHSSELISDINMAFILAADPENFAKFYIAYMDRLRSNISEAIQAVTDQNKLPEYLSKFPLIFLGSIVMSFIGYRIDDFTKKKILWQIDKFSISDKTTTMSADVTHQPKLSETAAD
ncbi:MAG TPA: hypothetical protein VF209_04260 [Patescibacteria group bacterium]